MNKESFYITLTAFLAGCLACNPPNPAHQYSPSHSNAQPPARTNTGPIQSPVQPKPAPTPASDFSAYNPSNLESIARMPRNGQKVKFLCNGVGIVMDHIIVVQDNFFIECVYTTNSQQGKNALLNLGRALDFNPQTDLGSHRKHSFWAYVTLPTSKGQASRLDGIELDGGTYLIK